MGIFSTSVATPAAGAGAAYATIHTPAGRTCRIREIGSFNNAATASSIGLIRPTNTPVATTSVLGQAQDPILGASLVNVDTAWSTAPTVGTTFFRRVQLPATISAGIIWTFPIDAPLILAASSWLVVWNFGAGAGSVQQLYMVWDE